MEQTRNAMYDAPEDFDETPFIHKMNPTEFRVSTRRTRNPELSDDQQKLNAALGLGEVGELQNIIKKELFHDHDARPDQVLDEAGDVLYYIDWVLDIYGFTLEDAFNHNSAKLSARYPSGFDPEKSRNRAG